MRAELESQDIEAIVQRVVELLKPLLAGNGKQDAEDRLLTVKELSAYIGYSTRWIYNNQKKLQPEYLNGKPLYRLSKINALLKQDKPDNSNPSPLQTRAFRQQTARR